MVIRRASDLPHTPGAIIGDKKDSTPTRFIAGGSRGGEGGISALPNHEDQGVSSGRSRTLWTHWQLYATVNLRSSDHVI
jgi:hypothetical protein